MQGLRVHKFHTWREKAAQAEEEPAALRIILAEAEVESVLDLKLRGHTCERCVRGSAADMGHWNRTPDAAETRWCYKPNPLFFQNARQDSVFGFFFQTTLAIYGSVCQNAAWSVTISDLELWFFLCPGGSTKGCDRHHYKNYNKKTIYKICFDAVDFVKDARKSFHKTNYFVCRKVKRDTSGGNITKNPQVEFVCKNTEIITDELSFGLDGKEIVLQKRRVLRCGLDTTKVVLVLGGRYVCMGSAK